MSEASVVSRLKGICPTLSVGVASADIMALGNDLARLDGTGVEILHFDIMDGFFVPMMTFGSSLVKAVKTDMIKDVHLMVERPIDKIEEFAKAGADIITVHPESCRHILRVLQMIGEMENVNHPKRGILRGVAINPGTLVETLCPLLDFVDMITLLAVNPGWSGQTFIKTTSERIDVVHKMVSSSRKNILLMVDGGINKGNIADVVRMGADIVVTGSAVFDGNDPAENARFMMDAIKNA